MVADSVELRDLADSLVTSEATLAFTNSEFIETFTFSRLKPPLLALMGTGGFRSLIGSALCRAQRDTPWLRGVKFNNDGSFESLDLGCSKLSAADCHAGHVELLTQILINLVDAVGPVMTRAIVQDTWPLIDPDDELFAVSNFKPPSAALQSV